MATTLFSSSNINDFLNAVGVEIDRDTLTSPAMIGAVSFEKIEPHLHLINRDVIRWVVTNLDEMSGEPCLFMSGVHADTLISLCVYLARGNSAYLTIHVSENDRDYETAPCASTKMTPEVASVWASAFRGMLDRGFGGLTPEHFIYSEAEELLD